MQYKKFSSLEELLLSEEFKKKDLSYCDLSGIDLSGLSEETWYEFEFNHTNFTNTNIKFNPAGLKIYNFAKYGRDKPYFKLEYCNFTNCDLSYLEDYDFNFVIIKGSNFTNCILDIEFEPSFNGYYNEDKDYSDVTFPENYENIEDLYDVIDYKTIKNNPHIYFPSDVIFTTISKEIPKTYLSNKKIEELNILIDEMLDEDEKRGGCLKKFEKVFFTDNHFSTFEKICFYNGKIIDKEFDKIDLSSIPAQLINKLSFIRCSFKKIIFPENFECDYDLYDEESKYYHVYFPTIKPDLWYKFQERRLGESSITFRRNLYLELGRFCNAKCQFCRNQYLDTCTYSLETIKENLMKISRGIDSVVIGGGEPTLLLNDLNILVDYCKWGIFNWTIFTNASSSLDDLIKLPNDYKLNISRHSVNDDINNRIFGVNTLSTSELLSLSENSRRTITLCPTCFKGDGVDTVEKIEDYIQFAYDCNIKNILFQTLHKDLDNKYDMKVLPIDDEIFDEVIKKLEEQGFDIGIPIYSTGDYKLIIAKKDGKTIAFKKYITEEELQREWYRASKRTFDLSMDPSGNIYQNWHQSSGKVLIK